MSGLAASTITAASGWFDGPARGLLDLPAGADFSLLRRIGYEIRPVDFPA
jgi:hypothetical protein